MFEQLYRTDGARVESIAYRRELHDAGDAVQETFLKVYRGIDGFAGASSIGVWLCRIWINAHVAKLPRCHGGARLPRLDEVSGRGHIVGHGSCCRRDLAS